MAKSDNSWRGGPELPNQFTEEDMFGDYPGENLGLPEKGPGSQASVLRRMIAVLIDWTLCWAAAGLIYANTKALGDVATITIALWVILGVLCGWLLARTPGMAVLGMGVARIDAPGQRLRFWQAALRTIFTMFVLPAALVDPNGRGMHDRATGTTVIRS